MSQRLVYASFSDFNGRDVAVARIQQNDAQNLARLPVTPRNANTARSWQDLPPPRRSSRPPLTSNERKCRRQGRPDLLTTSHIPKEPRRFWAGFAATAWRQDECLHPVDAIPALLDFLAIAVRNSPAHLR